MAWKKIVHIFIYNLIWNQFDQKMGNLAPIFRRHLPWFFPYSFFWKRPRLRATTIHEPLVKNLFHGSFTMLNLFLFKVSIVMSEFSYQQKLSVVIYLFCPYQQQLTTYLISEVGLDSPKWRLEELVLSLEAIEVQRPQWEHEVIWNNLKENVIEILFIFK